MFGAYTRLAGQISLLHGFASTCRNLWSTLTSGPESPVIKLGRITGGYHSSCLPLLRGALHSSLESPESYVMYQQSPRRDSLFRSSHRSTVSPCKKIHREIRCQFCLSSLFKLTRTLDWHFCFSDSRAWAACVRRLRQAGDPCSERSISYKSLIHSMWMLQEGFTHSPIELHRNAVTTETAGGFRNRAFEAYRISHCDGLNISRR